MRQLAKRLKELGLAVKFVDGNSLRVIAENGEYLVTRSARRRYSIANGNGEIIFNTLRMQGVYLFFLGLMEKGMIVYDRTRYNDLVIKSFWIPRYILKKIENDKRFFSVSDGIRYFLLRGIEAEKMGIEKKKKNERVHKIREEIRRLGGRSIVKSFRFAEEDLNILERIADKHFAGNVSAALRYLIRAYGKNLLN